MITVVTAITLIGSSAELAWRQAHYYDRASSAMRSSIHPQGDSELWITARKVSSFPPIVGTWVVEATGTHRSWTDVPIFAIGVEGELELTVGGDDYTESDSDGELDSDEVEIYTWVESDGVWGSTLRSAEASASSVHEFYDSELGGWLFIESGASGGM